MGGSSKKVTVGYRYSMGLHFGICHGPVDWIGEIRVGDRTAWTGDVQSSQQISIAAPNLFGGDEREGGVVGAADIMFGEADQVANSYLSSKIGGLMPAFRGILGVVFRGGLVSSNNPYVKPWAFKLTRINDESGGAGGGEAWLPEYAAIYKTPPVLTHWEVNAFSVTWVGGWAGTDTDGNPRKSVFRTFIEALYYVIYKVSGPVGALIATEDSGDIGAKLEYVFNPGVQIVSGNNVLWSDNGVPGAFNRFAIEYSGVEGWEITEAITEAEFFGSSELIEPETGLFENPPVAGAMMNPAHIIRQCLTNTVWGMGYSVTLIDDDAFEAAAETLFDEGFGLSLIWNQQSKIGEFIQTVLDHIGAVLYADPRTGKFVLKLIRDDYDAGALEVFDESNIAELVSFQRVGYGETVNEITVVYTDNDTDKPAAITVQDLANVQAQGAVVSQTRQYPGIRTAAIAARVAERDLMAASLPLAKARLRVNRTAWSQVPGGVIKLSWGKLGIEQLIVRVLAVNTGTLTDGAITVEVAEDVFGLPENSYAQEQPNEWEEPSSAPAAAENRVVAEASYYELLQTLGATDLAALADDAGFLSTAAVRPSDDSLDYEIQTDTGSGYSEAGRGDFCPSGLLTAALDHTTTSITLDNLVDADQVATGTYALIDEEFVRIDAFDSSTGAATIGRGVLDTVAATHADNARVYFLDGFTDTDSVERLDAEEVDVKLLPRTGQGALSVDSAPDDTVTFDQRQFRPYPPGQFRINGEAYPDTLDEGPVFTWAHRDRTQQNLEGDETGNIGPEDGTTYTLELTDVDTSTVTHTATGITAATYTPTAFYGTYTLKVELWSVRDGLASRQRHSHTFEWDYPAPSDDPHFGNVVLLIGFEGSDGSTTFTDESLSAHALTSNGNAQVDTAQFKYGSASGLFDGAGDYISAADSDDWYLDASDFTIELWYRPASIGARQFLCGQGNNGATIVRNLLEVTAAGKFRYYSGAAGADVDVLGTTILSAGTWYHLAATREGTTYRVFVDGNKDTEVVDATALSNIANAFAIGRCGEYNSLYANGHIDELRITKGVARYTANFAPPGAAFPRLSP